MRSQPVRPDDAQVMKSHDHLVTPVAPLRLAAVVPTYNEGTRLPAFLDDWVAEGHRYPGFAAVLIVVDDGSAADEAAAQQRAVESAAEALRSAGSPHRIEYVRAPRNQGKGASVRLGWRRAGDGQDWLGFIDADGAVPAGEFWRVARLLSSAGEDAVCGSRVKMAGRSVERSLFRHVQGRVFATCVEELFQLGFYDTQCGLKFFRAATLGPLLPRLKEDRWLLDVEVLDLLREAGARFLEVPIDCHQQQQSSLVFGIDPLKIGLRLVALRRRLRRERGGAR
jgi:dolichyl-phosphate beta-glucosyltransferase